MIANSFGGSNQDLDLLPSFDGSYKVDFGTRSNLIYTMAASSALAYDKYTALAGIISLTGSGSVTINTFTRVRNGHQHDQILQPAVGLTITIPANNIASGFAQRTSITADGSLGEKIIIKEYNDRWIAEIA